MKNMDRDITGEGDGRKQVEGSSDGLPITNQELKQEIKRRKIAEKVIKD